MQVDIDALGHLAGKSLFHVQGTLGREILKTAQEEQFQKISNKIELIFFDLSELEL